MRLPVLAGGRIGTPWKVTELPLTTPRKTFGAGVVPFGAVTGTPVAAGEPFCAGTLPTYATQPVSGVPHGVCGRLAPYPITVVEPGSSISSNASEAPFRRRLVTWVFNCKVTSACGICVPTGNALPFTQFKTMSPTNSVKPSAGTVGVTTVVMAHVMAGWVLTVIDVEPELAVNPGPGL